MKQTNNIIPIVFASNEYFIPYTAVMIQSIMENASPENQYRFFILHSGIAAAALDMLAAQTAKFPYCSLENIDISGRIKDDDLYAANRPDITRETYFRLFIPELFAEHEKIVYLDGDMICRSDISRLYAFDLGDNLIGAARDIGGISWFLHSGESETQASVDFKSNISNIADYYNAGMLVFNIRQFQNALSTADLFNLAMSKKWIHEDQDVLNAYTEGRTCFLPYSWNFIIDENPGYIPENLAKEYTDAIGHEDIIHFAGPRKPWINPVFVDSVYIKYFMIFWKYALSTPFIDTIIGRMEENHIIGRSYEPFVLDQIKNRNGGVRFILECIKARIGRKKAPDK